MFRLVANILAQLLKVLNILVALFLFMLYTNFALANLPNYIQGYNNYSFLDLKIVEEKNALTDQRIKNALIAAPYSGVEFANYREVPRNAAKTGIKVIEAGNYTFTKAAAKHLATRPYMNSPSTITDIIKSGKGVPDAYFKGGVNYKVPGTFNGSQGEQKQHSMHRVNMRKRSIQQEI